MTPAGLVFQERHHSPSITARYFSAGPSDSDTKMLPHPASDNLPFGFPETVPISGIPRSSIDPCLRRRRSEKESVCYLIEQPSGPRAGAGRIVRRPSDRSTCSLTRARVLWPAGPLVIGAYLVLQP